jgi:hypothetical protein
MDAKQSENLFASLRAWKYQPPTGQPRMDANGREAKRELIRVYSWFWKYELSGKGFTARFIRGSANE